MRIAITGDRTWKGSIYERAPHTDLIAHAIIEHQPDYVILGDATGVDYLAACWCQYLAIPHTIHRATWALDGRAAGPIRNRAMLDEHPDLLLAFHDYLNGSKGTKNCVEQALERGIAVKHYTSKGFGGLFVRMPKKSLDATQPALVE